MIALQQQMPDRPPPGSTPGDTATATPVVFGLLAVGLVMTLVLCGLLAWALTRKAKPTPGRGSHPQPQDDDTPVISVQESKESTSP